jgi:hypothetical protein
MKGFEKAVHERAILAVEVSELRKANARLARRKAQKRSYVQKNGTLSIQVGQDKLVQREVELQLQAEVQSSRQSRTREAIKQPVEQLRTRAPPRCSRCDSLEHTARTCQTRGENI